MNTVRSEISFAAFCFGELSPRLPSGGDDPSDRWSVSEGTEVQPPLLFFFLLWSARKYAGDSAAFFFGLSFSPAPPFKRHRHSYIAVATAVSSPPLFLNHCCMAYIYGLRDLSLSICARSASPAAGVHVKDSVLKESVDIISPSFFFLSGLARAYFDIESPSHCDSKYGSTECSNRNLSDLPPHQFISTVKSSRGLLQDHYGQCHPQLPPQLHRWPSRQQAAIDIP